MIKRVLLLLVFVLAASTSAFAQDDHYGGNVTCTGVMSGGASGPLNINGNVIVPDHASCTLSFVNVRGNVQTGHGSSLLITAYTEPSTIGGNVIAIQCNSALLEGNVTVGGNVVIASCTGGGPNGFQGPDTRIEGNFLCQANSSNAAPCLVWLGKVDGNVEIYGNAAPTPSDVSLVSIGGNLQCEQNSLAPSHIHGPSWVDGRAQDQCAGFATTTTQIDSPVTPAASCAALAGLPATGFPVPNTVITSAVDTPATATLPERCIINGYVNQHVSPVDNCAYLNGFQVQLPLPAAWNGRYMAQGGGGTEGSVPTATGTDSGSAGSNFGIINGYAVASQDGGHENSLLAASTCGITSAGVPTFSQTTTVGFGNPNEFFLDPMGRIGEANQSIETTTLTAKYLIDQYYGKDAKRSYWVGCSTGGRQAMGMSQNFPSFFDGIVAGDGIYDQEAAGFSEGYGTQQILDDYVLDLVSRDLPALANIAQTAPEPAAPHLYPAFPIPDQTLFETALLQACDALDGVTDGVIDNLPACQAKFNPATAKYVDYANANGGGFGVTYPLQCPGAKNATCLSPNQIQAAIKINAGAGDLVAAGAVAPDHAPNIAQGYMYDGGWMASSGIPSREIGPDTPTSVPGNFGGNTVGTFGFSFLSPADPTFPTLAFNFLSELPGPPPPLTVADFTGGVPPPVATTLNPVAPIVTDSTSLDLSHFVHYGHKIIWYHGLSDPGPPVLYNLIYYTAMAQQRFAGGSLQTAQNFSRFYGIPNMDHCTGGPTTDQFDMLTPLVSWVENGTAPSTGPVSTITATGVNFNATTYQVLGNYIMGPYPAGYPGPFISAPTTRNRPLCPYPQQARFTGRVTISNGVPVASNPADLASASNYTCIPGQPLNLPHLPNLP
jgi:Tannase and feruloyl esterase